MKTHLQMIVRARLRWAGNKPELEQDMRMSLSHRNEDARF
jgi:hypothetical protein